MKAKVFRDLDYIPSPVTSICSNHSVIIAFRRDHALEMIDSKTFFQFLRYDIGYEIIQSYFLNLNNIICLSKCGVIITFDINSLEKSIYDHQATNISLAFTNAFFSDIKFLFTSIKNELFLFQNEKTSLLLKESQRITALFHNNSQIFYGTKDGSFKVLSEGKCVLELDIRARINKISHFTDCKYIVITDSGSAALIDISLKMILDSVAVRKSSLNILECLNDTIYFSGADSRIISYKIINNKLSKIAQGDFHFSDVLCSTKDDKRIITAGEDSQIILNFLQHEKHFSYRIFDSAVFCGKVQEYFYSATDKSFDLYKLKEQFSEISKEENQFNDKITFKISESVLENINQNQTNYSHFLKFNINKKLNDLKVSLNGKYLAYSTAESTVLFNLFRGDKLSIEKMNEFPGATQIFFTNNFLIILTIDKKVLFLDLGNFESVSELSFEDYRERIIATEQNVLFLHSKVLLKYEDPSDPSEIKIEEEIIDGFADNDGTFYILTRKKDTSFVLYSLTETELIIVQEINNSLTNMKFASSDILFNNRFLYMLNEENKISIYDLDSIIHGCVRKEDHVIIIQSSFNYLQSKLKPGIFKEKYSN